MKILFILCTRFEAIKKAPLIKTVQGYKPMNVVVAVTDQHKEMLYQVLDFFPHQT